MKTFLIIAFALIISACDPMDNRLKFQNKTNDDVFVRFCFIDSVEIHGSSGGLRLVPKTGNKAIGIIGTWDSEYKRMKPMHLMHVIVYDNYNFLADPIEQSTKVKSDSLLRIGDYQFKKYSYEELVSRKWKVVYPDDGFEEGVPLVDEEK